MRPTFFTPLPWIAIPWLIPELPGSSMWSVSVPRRIEIWCLLKRSAPCGSAVTVADDERALTAAAAVTPPAAVASAAAETAAVVFLLSIGTSRSGTFAPFYAGAARTVRQAPSALIGILIARRPAARRGVRALPVAGLGL